MVWRTDLSTNNTDISVYHQCTVTKTRYYTTYWASKTSFDFVNTINKNYHPMDTSWYERWIWFISCVSEPWTIAIWWTKPTKFLLWNNLWGIINNVIIVWINVHAYINIGESNIFDMGCKVLSRRRPTLPIFASKI